MWLTSTVDSLGDTALIKAAKCKNEKIVSLLVEAKADVSIRNHESESAASIAELKKRAEGILYMLSNKIW